MVVVFIIGLAASLVALTLPDRVSAEEKAAQVFAQTLQTAQDQAIMSGEPIGVSISEDGYTVQVWRRGQWRAVRGGDTFARGIDIKRRLGRDETEIEDWPSLVLDPTGVTDGAVFDLTGPNDQLTINFLPTGVLQIDAL
ncbi:MAG: hypothetical protein Hens3KO_07970 [Henriciella sp.]